MRLLAPLVIVGALLTTAATAAPPSTPELQRTAARLVATNDIPGVIALFEQDGRRTVVAAGRADIAWGHTGGTPGYVTFAAGSRDGRQLVVLAVNGVGPGAIRAMGRYLDTRLLCR